MEISTITAARHGDVAVSLREYLLREHRRGQLLPRLNESVREAFLLDQAQKLGLRVENAELQKAADVFRRRRSLHTASAATAWLAQNRLSTLDFEASLERTLLLQKLPAHVVGAEAKLHFQQEPGLYDRIRWRRILATREDLAQEIAIQVAEEGGDFGELARRHSQHPSASNAGRDGPHWRGHLSQAIRANLVDAEPGSLLGPIAAADGYHLFQIEEIQPATYDDATAACIVRERFAIWLDERLSKAPFAAPLLELLT